MGPIETIHMNLSSSKMVHLGLPRNLCSTYRYVYLKHVPSAFSRASLYQPSDTERTMMLAIRLVTIMLLVTMLTMHVRYLRVFRWEQSVSGGVLVTYTIAVVGLTLCSGSGRCGSRVLQAYISSTGAALLVANCAAIWRRCKIRVPLRRYIILKVCLSAVAAICMLIDLALVPIFAYLRHDFEYEPE